MNLVVVSLGVSEFVLLVYMFLAAEFHASLHCKM